MAAKQYSVTVHMKSDWEKVWQCIRYSAALFPSALPKEYKKTDVIKGDGNSLDSIRIVHFADGWWDVTTAMMEIREVNEGSKTLSYDVIGGDLLKYCKPFTATLVVTQAGSGSLVNWTANFNEPSNFPKFFEDFIIKTFIDLDAFLLGA